MSVKKRNIVLKGVTETMQYKPSNGGGGHKRYPEREDVVLHANSIRSKYDKLFDHDHTATLKTNGTYAEFSGKQGYELAVNSLENRRSGVRLLNVQEDDGVQTATVFIPSGKERFLSNRIDDYSSKTTKDGKNPKNKDLIGSIEDVKQATVLSFWTDRIEKIPGETACYCEIWLRYEIKKDVEKEVDYVEQAFHESCDELKITVDKGKKIVFPERIVKLVKANRAELDALLMNCDYVTEIKRAESPASFFTELASWEQKEWIDELLGRCHYADTDVSICILDAGINSEHKLIEPALLANGVHSAYPDWGTTDSANWNGHGTRMAGIAIYDDLQKHLESEQAVEIDHSVESVKILTNQALGESNLFGAVTRDAAYIAEIENPNRNRIFCMAVTLLKSSFEDGRPSSWSAALDELTSGATDQEPSKRLFIVSAGNTAPSDIHADEYHMFLGAVQDPAQSWNAVTVGGYADKIEISDIKEKGLFRGFTAIAPLGGISPYSTSSINWDKSKWPVKPEVLFRAGNAATNGKDVSGCDDLSALTTGHRPLASHFSTINATSLATAQASNFAAKLCTEYPELWPETIRALMIHSARWTDEMLKQFCPNGYKASKSEAGTLLRYCGYGIPDLDIAIQCMDNYVNMVVQSEFMPFVKKGSGATMNDMQFHSFPWPRDLLMDLGETEIELRVTLSYFIEPSPGEIGWKNKYRYRSCGLKFDLKRTGESVEEFKRRVNKKVRDEDGVRSSSAASSYGWFLGTQNRDVGSIHSDFIKATAASLCEADKIAVYPTGGWWKERTYLGKSEEKIRYSLVVSLSTPEETVDLYTPIATQIANTVSVAI